MKHWDKELPGEAKPRTESHMRKILTRLEQGPVSNRELAAISLKYTGRISDLRMNGYVIECFDHNRETGEAWYRFPEKAAA